MLYVLDFASEKGTELDKRVGYQLALSVLADDTDEGLLRMMQNQVSGPPLYPLGTPSVLPCNVGHTAFSVLCPSCTVQHTLKTPL
eukprot:5220198-Pyramimonas_sp.AAC.1